MSELYTIDNGKLSLHLHPGQTRAWDSDARIVIIYAGTQSGKTTFGPWWLHREIQERGPGDYLAVTATFDLFKLKMLPEIRKVFEQILGGWTYHKSDRVLYSSNTVSRRKDPTKAESRIILRSANSPGGLESATAKACWMDEFGQDEFSIDAYEAINRRVSLEEGRILGTTTPYNLGWQKTEIYDRWTAGDKDFHVIQFYSTENPTFSREEFERARRTMPAWKFAMFYMGEFSTPAGLIYDCFDTKLHKIMPFSIPAYWPKYGGLDFGGVNTGALCYAENPDIKVLYLVDEYRDGRKSAAEHAKALKEWHCRLWVGGAKSEGQWRLEFAKAGLPIAEPLISDVEVGIQRVYAQHKTNSLYVFDTCTKYLDEKGRYSRELDRSGQPTEKIKNKNDFHLMDSERYIISHIRGSMTNLPETQPEKESRWHTEIEGEIGRDRKWREL